MTCFRKIHVFLTFILVWISFNTFGQVKATLARDTSKSDNTFLYNQIKYDTVSVANRAEYIEKLNHLDINSGTIYFSGAGFPDVASTTFKGKMSIHQSFLSRFVSGSKITFEKCTFKNDDGTISKLLNKSIYFK